MNRAPTGKLAGRCSPKTGHGPASPARSMLRPSARRSRRLLHDVHGRPLVPQVVLSALGSEAQLAGAPPPSAGAPAGDLTAEAGTGLGPPAGIPVAAGAGDTAAAPWAAGIGPGDIQLTVGTGAQVIRLLPRRSAGRTPGSTSTGRRLRTAGTRWAPPSAQGSGLNWVRKIMNATWAELYASADHPGQAHDPIFDPHLSGERTPYSDRRPVAPGPDCCSPATGPRSCGARSKDSRFGPRRAGCPAGGASRAGLRLAGGGLWRRAGGSRSRMCWGCRCTPWTCPQRPAGALPFGGRCRWRAEFCRYPGMVRAAGPARSEPDPAMAAFRAERHARFRHIVSALKATQTSADRDAGPGGRPESPPGGGAVAALRRPDLAAGLVRRPASRCRARRRRAGRLRRRRRSGPS